MTIHFFIKYKTHFGQSIFLSGNNSYLGDNDPSIALALSYLNEEMWSVSVEFPDDFDDLLLYEYIVRNEDGSEIYDGEENRSIDFSLFKGKNFKIIDTWVSSGNIGNVFFTRAFIDVLLPPVAKIKSSHPKKFTHEFRVKAPLLQPGETICLCGSTQNLRSWDIEDPIILTPVNNWFSTKVHLEDNEWPASYKYGIYNLSGKKMIHFENGENRRLPRREQESEITFLHDGFVNFDTFLWKGAGVLIPVFSLRSKKSFGVGEFTDLKLLIDWAKVTGLQIIQLLPVNDTTAHKNHLDSYPYAAISAFALHPIYINLE
ncbi:MAG: 4-alpha-glucanotransferase, partial [Ginsengibacter sp.]